MSSMPVSRTSLKALLLALWTILVGGARVFAWDSLKSGFIDIRPLPRVMRVLALAGLALVFIFIASILYNDTLRLAGTLEALPMESSAARGILVPSLAVPLGLLASILAWTLLLTGALHVLWWVRLGVLVGFLTFGVPGLIFSAFQTATGDDSTLVLVALGVLGLTVLILLIGVTIVPRLRLPLAFEFILMLTAVGGLNLVVVFLAGRNSQLGAINFVSGYVVPDAVTEPRNLVIPFLFLAGAELANFGISFTRWGAQSAARYGNARVFGVVLFALLAYRLAGFVAGLLGIAFLSPGNGPVRWEGYVGAALVGVGLIPIAWWRARKPAGDSVPIRVLVLLIMLATVPQLLLVIAITVVSGVFAMSVSDPTVLAQMDRALSPLVSASGGYQNVRTLLVALAGVVIAYVGVRRARFSVAAFGMILAWTLGVYWFMERGRPLEAIRYQYSDLDLWLTLALAGLTLYWLVRRELSAERALALAALAFFAWVLGFTDFLDNPLSLFLGFTGIFFTAFGILWSVLTAGGKFANVGSKNFPRASRILMYLGYALMTVNITHWFVVTHNVPEQTLNGSFTTSGLRLFGLAVAYLVFVEGGRALLKGEER